MTSQFLTQSENIGDQGLHVLKSKARILSTITNKDTRIHDAASHGLTTAFERQRENASKLASGRSVVSKADKENKVVFKKPVRVGLKLPNKPVKTLEPKKCGLQKSGSRSINEEEAVKEKSSKILKPHIVVSRIKRASLNKRQSKLKPVTNEFQIREDKEVKKEKKEVEERKEENKVEIRREVKEVKKEKKEVEEVDKRKERKEENKVEIRREVKEVKKEKKEVEEVDKRKERKEENKVEIRREFKEVKKEKKEVEEVDKRKERKEENKVEIRGVIDDEDNEEELLLKNINIIDKDEDVHNSEFTLGSYAKDVYDFLHFLEEKQSIRENYLTRTHIMTQNMRAVLVDWMFYIQQSFRLLSETIQLSIALLDRFMQDHPTIMKDELQLVAVTCIFLASKYEEMFPPDLEDLVHISADAYTKRQILKMEQIILLSLDFQMGRPVPSQFLRRYGKAGRVDCITYFFSKYFIDLSLVDYALCHVKPSHLAAASLYLSLYLTSDEMSEKLWTPTLVHYSKYSAEELKPLASKIASIVLEVPKSKFQNVPRKYLDSVRFYSVSARPELTSSKLMKIAKEIETCSD